MKERIRYLFLQYYYSKSTRKELDEFFYVVHSAKHNAEISDMIKEAYEELKQAEPSLTFIDEAGQLVLKEPSWSRLEKSSPLIKRTPVIGMAVAAVLILFGGLSYWFIGHGSFGNKTDVILQKFTDQNQQIHLMLSDSTIITLNSSSSISYPEKFTGKTREVVLSGEAFFDVKHADKIPFLIHTGKITTTVLGTAFNIKAYANSSAVNISVQRGKVAVLEDRKVIAMLVKGEGVKVGQLPGSHAEKALKKRYDPEEVGGWQQGYLSYEDEPLGEIINDLKRTYNVDIFIEKSQVKNLLITSSFKREIGVKRALGIICNLTESKLKTSNQQFIIN